MDNETLPPLPKPATRAQALYDDEAVYFSAEQMRAYARAALAERPASQEEKDAARWQLFARALDDELPGVLATVRFGRDFAFFDTSAPLAEALDAMTKERKDV